MCGIVGYFSRGPATPSQQALDQAVDLLAHRGPDDQGSWLNANVGLGARRLSIQDLSDKGHQPMVSSDGRYVIAFNGEVYNFKQLRSGLESKGHSFASGTDTEVLLRLFQTEGRSCLEKLNGMFAIAIYERESRKLFLARDRLGIKPLYLLDVSQGLFFASEFKAFLPFVEELSLPWQFDENSLYEYMLFRYVAGPRTVLEHVRQCPPGSWMEVDADGCVKTGQYYSLEDLCAEANDRQLTDKFDEESCVDGVRERLRESIQLRLVSDAPLGIALSGGVDSSLITALLREIHSSPIKTFSVVFDEKESHGRTIDESPYSDWVSQKYQTEHTRLILDQKRFADIYPQAVWHTDDPLNIPNSLGVFLFSEAAAPSVKVLLSGEGADEAFGGYEHFADPRPLHPMKHRLSRAEDIRKLVRFPNEALTYRDELLEASHFQGANAEIYYSLRSYLLTVVNRLDKMSMANGIEMRVPFLDHGVVEAAIALPSIMKVRGQTTKYVLKSLAERYVPHQHAYRPKVGFSTPLNMWLQDERHLGRYISILEEPRSLDRPFIRKKGVLELLAAHRHGPDTFRFSIAGRIWMLLNLELWIRTFLEDKRPLAL